MLEGLRRTYRSVEGYVTAGFDAAWKAKLFLVSVGLVCFFFPFSLLFVVAGLLPPGFDWVATVIIAMNGIATLSSEFREKPTRRALGEFLLVVAFLFLLEKLGVTTGFPFGRYAYTTVLGFSFWGVPAAIAFAWYSTVVNGWRIAEWLLDGSPIASAWRVAIVAGLLTVVLDMALEPMAAFVKGYWVWDRDVIPLQNYLSWFVLSATAAYVLAATDRSRGRRTRHTPFPVAFLLFGSQFLLFVLTNVVHGHIAVSLMAMVLALLLFALRALLRYDFSSFQPAKK